MTPTGRRSGRRDWLLCGVDIAAVLALLALSSRTGDPLVGIARRRVGRPHRPPTPARHPQPYRSRHTGTAIDRLRLITPVRSVANDSHDFDEPPGRRAGWSADPSAT